MIVLLNKFEKNIPKLPINIADTKLPMIYSATGKSPPRYIKIFTKPMINTAIHIVDISILINCTTTWDNDFDDTISSISFDCSNENMGTNITIPIITT